MTIKVKRFFHSFMATVLFICTALAFGQVQFSGLDLSEDDILLFQASVDAPEFGTYNTLFSADLKDKSIAQLTFYPERMSYLQDSNQLQIQNRFGVFRTDANLSNLSAVQLFPSFENGQDIAVGKIPNIQSSPDGKYLLFTRPTSTAYGDLIMFDRDSSQEMVVAKNLELSLRHPIGLWAPDSRFFVYCRDGSLIYYSIHQYSEDRVLDESYRKIHPGTINSAMWGTGNFLYYITDTLVYRIGSTEFFTESLYSGLLKMGDIVGKIPFKFNPNFDNFWIAPDGRKILLSVGERNLFLYYLDNEDFSAKGEIKPLPYLYLPRNTSVEKVLWSTGDTITLLTSSLVQGETKTNIFRLEMGENGDSSAFEQTSDEKIKNIYLSPLETSAALVTEDRVLIFNYLTWEKQQEITFTKPLSAVWTSETQIIIAGEFSIRAFDLNDNTSKLVALAQTDAHGFSEDTGNIQVKVNGNSYTQDDGVWTQTGTLNTGSPQIASIAYRVYLETSHRGQYKNIVMVRDIQGYGTTPLFPPETILYENYPEKEDPVNFTQFNHGSRIRGREVALVFNVTDSIEGLTLILNILSEYSINATFFINGEAIRRYPGAIKEIADSQHEVGSLFYMYFNMTDSRFILNSEFIKQGMARTEDDYFNATSKEISLLWHAPYYFVNSDIIEASREMNYTYVGRDVDAMDWVTKSTTTIAAEVYIPSAELLERILEKKKPGSIIPILVGIPSGEREDYLFQKLDLLINDLLDRGYRIVTVSNLIENAK